MFGRIFYLIIISILAAVAVSLAVTATGSAIEYFNKMDYAYVNGSKTMFGLSCALALTGIAFALTVCGWLVHEVRHAFHLIRRANRLAVR
jgi:sterol desaturase/sphingolipid hydroxylase (fatty acid hydroxylase superfamily)